MRRADLLRSAVARLQASGIDAPARDARLLLRAASQLDPASLTARLGESAPPAEAAQFETHIAARIRRQPVAQIVGYRHFWGRNFTVTSAVLDPRPETETLIAEALDGPKAQRILDLGTGSGVLLISLLAEWPEATGLGTDLSSDALAVAVRNAACHGMQGRAAFEQSDWLAAVTGRFDLILCNPPYIGQSDIHRLAPELLDWEPRMALSPGQDPLCVYRLLSRNLEVHLAPGGRILFEIGLNQAPELLKIYSETKGWRTSFRNDFDGRPRCAIVQR
ncbi:MAG: peptide chain release factor N(5)-glutamine methyltransferase [Pseudomonadota bacterium]